MKDLKYYEKIIQEKRKQTSFRDFLKDIASWFPIMLVKNKGKISIFPDTPRSGNIVDKKQYFEKHENTLLDEINLEGDFFDLFQQNFRDSYKPNVIHFRDNLNSDFSNCVFGAQNVYLSFVIWEECENIAYSCIVYNHCSNVLYSMAVFNHCDNIYYCSNVSNSSNIFYSINIHNGSHITNCSNLMGCHNCIECDGLENMSYCYQNKQYSKQEFNEIQKTYQASHYTLEKKWSNFASENTSGQNIFYSNDVEKWYFVNRLDSWRNVFYIGGWKLSTDFYDVFESGLDSKDFYGVTTSGGMSNNVYCSCLIDNGCSHILYSYFLDSCSFCVWCVGLKNKSYCILNKQYSKEEWNILADKIFSKMELDGSLGEFFPWKMTPFHFNDTMAWLLWNFTKQEVTSDGYIWRDEEIKVDIPEGSRVITVMDLADYQGRDSDGSWKINPEIMKVVIRDEAGNYYRIVQMEYDFLVKHGLSLPDSHWMDRLKLNFWM